MSYSSAALTAAMNKSLYFKNIFNDPAGNTFNIGSFEDRGYYKVTILSEKTTVIFEFSQGRIISAQSISSKRTTDEKFKVQLTQNSIENNETSILSISGLKAVDEKVFSLTVEFSGGEFTIDPSVSNIELINGKEFSFNTTEFNISVVTSDINAAGFNVNTLTTNSLFVKELQFGDWVLQSDMSSGKVALKLKS